MTRHIVLAAILTVLGLASTGQAQTITREAVQDSMETCRTVEVDFMRRACLEAADAFLRSEPEPNVSEPVARAAAEEAATEVANEIEETAETDARRRRFGLLAPGRDREKPRDTLVVSVAGISTNRDGRSQFRLADGGVLVQFPGGYRLRRPAALPATAKLERRLFGSTWLTFDEFPDRGYKVRVVPATD